jgi:hypothetical protein
MNSVKTWLLVVGLLAATPPLKAQDCPELVGRWPYGSCSSVAAEGGFVYFGSGAVLKIGDIGDPANTQVLGEVYLPGIADDVAVSGGYAYVADGQWGLQIIDVSDPRSPFIAGSVDTPDSARGVAVSGTYAYVADDNSGLQVIDVSDPTGPFIAGSTNTPGACSGVSVSGFQVFLAESIAGMEIYSAVGCCSLQPGSFQLLSPPDGSGVGQTVLLDWEDSTESLAYDLYVDTATPPLALAAGDLPISETLLSFPSSSTYYWKVVARNGCGETESAVRSLTAVFADFVFRYESIVSLASSSPEETFETGSLPWADPDDVLEPGAPPVLFYKVTFLDTVIVAVKDARTVRLEAE